MTMPLKHHWSKPWGVPGATCVRCGIKKPRRDIKRARCPVAGSLVYYPISASPQSLPGPKRVA